MRPAVELRVPAPLRRGVDGHVRVVSGPGSPSPSPSPSPGASPGRVAADGRVVVVGASLAGLRAVETLRSGGIRGHDLAGGRGAAPALRPPPAVEAGAGGDVAAREGGAGRQAPSSELRVHEVLGRRAVGLDVDARRIELEDGEVLDGGRRGAGLRRGTAPSAGHRGAQAARRRLHACARSTTRWRCGPPSPRTEAARVVVIGAGFIGAEVASTCAALGCRVTVLEVLDIPLRNVLGPMLGAALRVAAHRARRGPADGRVGGGCAPDGRRTRQRGRPSAPLVVELADGETVPADVVVVGIGVAPYTDWLADSGLTIENGVVCDDRLFAADGVVAAGDVARWLWRHDGEAELIRIEHWEVAAQAGAWPRRTQPAGRARRRRTRSRRSPTSGPTSSTSASRCSGAPAGTTRSRSSTARSPRGSSSRCSDAPAASAP